MSSSIQVIVEGAGTESRAAKIGRQQETSRLKRVSWELFWIISGQAIGAAGSMVGVRILTGRLSPGAYGELALGMTIVTLVQQTLTGPLGQATLRLYAPAVDAKEVPRFFAAVKHLQASISIAILAAGAAAAIYLVASGHRSNLTLVLLALAISVVVGTNGTLDSLQTAARHRSVVALHQAATQWARPLAAWLLIIMMGSNSSVALAGYLVAACAIFLSQVYQMQRQFAGDFWESSSRDQKYIRQFLIYAWPFSVWGLFTALQLGSDRWTLSLALDNRSVGIYMAASQLGFAPIVLLATAASVFISPVLFSRAGDGSDPARVKAALKLNRQLVRLSALVSGLAALAIYALRDWLVRLMCGREYGEASKYLPGLVIAAGLFACGQIATHALLIHRQTKALIAPKIVTGILALALYVAGARVAGVYGVVTANIVWTLVYFLWVTWLAAVIGKRKRSVEPEDLRASS